MKLIDLLGQDIEEEWRLVEYDEGRLPDIASEALRNASLDKKITAWEIVEWAVSQSVLPEQRDLQAQFGDPPITVFNAPRFHIDVYFWLEGTTSIHQHAFCGAFQVLKGSSIHGHYSFDAKEEVNKFTRTGDLSLESCRLLETGAIQRILPGDQYIHSLFHLDQPSATIVVRTHLSPLDLPQYSYHKPGLAIDPFFEEPGTVKKIQALRMALRAKYENAPELVEQVLAGADFQTSYQILNALRPLLGVNQLKALFKIDESDGVFERMLEQVCGQHPKQAALLHSVFEEQKRTDILVKLRNVVSDSEHRFFLALLLNFNEREQVFALVKERFPGEDPKEKVLDWVTDLGITRVLDGSFPNALGVEGFTVFDGVVLEEIFKGKKDEEVIAYLSSSGVGSDDEKMHIRESIERIKSAEVFRALIK